MNPHWETEKESLTQEVPGQCGCDRNKEDDKDDEGGEQELAGARRLYV